MRCGWGMEGASMLLGSRTRVEGLECGWMLSGLLRSVIMAESYT